MNNQFGSYFSNYGQPFAPYNQAIGANNSNSNIILVTGIEEALYRTTARGSDMLYVHQTQPVFYRVKVDMEGRKTWSEYPYNVPQQDDNLPATKSELATVMRKIAELEAMIKPEVKDEQSV